MDEFQVGDILSDMTKVVGFHSKEGLFFKRLENGDVRIQQWTNSAPFTLLSSVVVDASTWASIVSSVSKRGEDGGSWRRALDFHDDKPSNLQAKILAAVEGLPGFDSFMNPATGIVEEKRAVKGKHISRAEVLSAIREVTG